MKAYKLLLWQPVYHDDTFSHNVERVVIIHARNEEEAIRKVPLKKGQDKSPHYITKNESLYKAYYLGRVTIRKYYVYDGDKNYNPTPIEVYKANLKRILKEAQQ